MKVRFTCYLDSDAQRYFNEPEYEYIEHDFIVEWGANPLPQLGDMIGFNSIIEKWPDSDKKKIFYDRDWFIEMAIWRQSDETNLFEPVYYLDKSEK